MRHAKLRLNMRFAGSTDGAHRACVLLGIVATCRAVSVPVEASLAWPSGAWEHSDQLSRPMNDDANRVRGQRLEVGGVGGESNTVRLGDRDDESVDSRTLMSETSELGGATSQAFGNGLHNVASLQ